MEQDVFINRIRAALGVPMGRDGRRRPNICDREMSHRRVLIKNIEQRTAPDFAALYQRLLKAAEPLNLRVRQKPDRLGVAREIEALVQEKTPEWGDTKSVVAWQHPLIDALHLAERLSKSGIRVYHPRIQEPSDADRHACRERVQKAFIGVTAADYCLADTATLVLKTRAGQPRSVSLVPSIHVAVITRQQLIADMQELFALLQEDPVHRAEGLTNCMTFISGPSKTADIEATLVHGAHGPREVYLYIVAH